MQTIEKPRRRASFVRMFKPQFAGKVECGEKLQTVRPEPKRMPQVGDLISLRAWTDKPYRSKQRVLREAEVRDVGKITITEVGYEVWDDGWKVMMTEKSRNAFARADGFEDWPALVGWFRETHGLPFHGILIKWG